MEMEKPFDEKSTARSKTIRLSGGRIYFPAQSLRRVFFWLTVFMLAVGMGYKLGLY